MPISEQIATAEQALVGLDPELGRIIKLQAPITHQPRSDYFFSLVRSVVGQQVSVAAAAAIFDRLSTATDLDPDRIVAMSDEQLRGVGLSRQKIRYIRDLAVKFAANPAVYEHLERLSDEDVIRELTAVIGIGVWSAQMFLMFTLVRLDVFAPDDVGLQRAMKNLYAWENVPPRTELEQMAARWKPYRTVASWHLWKSLRNEPLPG
jgi:DNA-3-methyladenine glycosylase II